MALNPMKKCMVWSSLFVVCSVLHSEAFACSCAMPKGSEKEQVTSALQSATEVLVAKVQSVKHSPTAGDASGKYTTEDAVFLVIEVLKGKKRPGDKVAIRSSIGPGFCGHSARNDPPWLEVVSEKETPSVAPPKISDTWLIYGEGAEPYELSQCSRSSPLEVEGVRQRDVEAVRDLRILRRLIPRSPQ
jgi:hypothetical protein